MAAEIRISVETAEVGAVCGLAVTIPTAWGGFGRQYDVTAHGQRILAAVAPGARRCRASHSGFKTGPRL
jgi:hypothetical protein